MPIKTIQLKNGSKYPVGEAWREPIVDGNPLDYPSSLDATGAGSLTMTVNMPGQDATTQTLTLFHITDNVLTNNELAWTSFDAVGATPSNPRIIVMSVDTPVIMDVPTAMILMTAMDAGIQIDPSDCTVTGSIPAILGFASNSQMLVAAASFSEAATEATVEVTIPIMEGVNATMEIVATVPAAGTYWMTPAESSFATGSTVDGTLHVGKWHMPRWFDPGRACAITNGMIIMLMQGSGVFHLATAPALAERIRNAAERGEQLALMLGYRGRMSISLAMSSSSFIWTFADESTITYTPSSSDPTLTYTAAS